MIMEKKELKLDGVRTKREKLREVVLIFEISKFQNWVFYLKLIKINNSKSKN